MKIKSRKPRPKTADRTKRPTRRGTPAHARYVLAACVVEFEQLATTYRSSFAEKGDSRLLGECMELFSDVRKNCGIAYENFNASEGRAYFALRSADDIELFCERLTELSAQRNSRRANPDFHVRFLLGIAACPPGMNERKAYERAVSEAFSVASVCEPGEIGITQEAFDALSLNRRSNYGQEEQIGDEPDDPPVTMHRRRVDGAGSWAAEKCVMSVDMAQFSDIQSRQEVREGPRGVARLQDEIKKILADGCQEGGVSYAEADKKFTGDGAIFVFDKPEQAHYVAVGILQSAELRHKRARNARVAVNDAMRCFRVGIVSGVLVRDGHGEPAGEIISRAKRLEGGGCSGEIRISPEAYQLLPQPLARLYGAQVTIPGKPHDAPIAAHRLRVSPPAPWEEPAPTAVVAVQPPAVLQPRECFVISQIDDHNARITAVFERLITPACRRLGFEPTSAHQIVGPDRIHVITDRLTFAPGAVAYLGRPTPNWNKNVLLELGFRLATKLPLVIISERPPVSGDGQSVPLTELLPFHIVHRNVVVLGDDPQDSVEMLVAYMQEAEKLKPRDEWATTHPIVEYKFSNVNTDLVLTEVSPQARQLFAIEHSDEPIDVEEMRERNRGRYVPKQYEAFRQEQREIVRKIRDDSMGLGDVGDADSCRIPVARIPLILKDAPLGPNRQPIGYLPIVVRYTFCDKLVHLRTLYLKVSASMKKGPNGVWVCDI